jgi:hypothetical protein
MLFKYIKSDVYSDNLIIIIIIIIIIIAVNLPT